jgi:putative Holliday junction resolvase
MSRVLGIDFGTKRTGIAVTDPLKITVNPLVTLATEEVVDYLTEYFSREKVEEIVCGYPGDENKQTVRALHQFVQKLNEAFPGVPVKYHDEHNTSRKAAEVIFRSGLPRKKRQEKALIDKVSAVLILQDYLGHFNELTHS